MACAMKQRGWKRQPLGGLAGLGTSPLRTMRCRLRVGSGTRIAESSDTVYGCRGAAYSISLVVSSTITPRYMTATRSLMCSTTEHPGGLRGVGAAGPHAERGGLPAHAGDRDGGAAGAHHL